MSENVREPKSAKIAAPQAAVECLRVRFAAVAAYWQRS